MKPTMHTRRFVRSATLLATLAALPATAQVKNYREIRYPALQEFAIPSPERFRLANGMTVFLMEDHELPLINVTARIRTGSNHEPADKTGLGGIFGQVQREGGTKSMSGDEIDEFLGLRAASVETSVSGDVGFASMSCLAEDFDAVFAVFNDVLRKPIFAEDKLDLAKVQANSSISRRNDNVGGIVGREFSRLIYGKDSPLSRLTEYATIAAISRDDLTAWHGKYYHPNNVLLGIAGDFDAKAMKKKLQNSYADWEKGPAFQAPPVPYAKVSKPGVYFIEKEDVTQANVRLGHLGIRVDNPDYFAVQVMNEVFGGGFSSRLFSSVRSEKGLAYSVFGGIGSSFVREGVFQVGLSTKSETMAESVAALREEVRKIIDAPPTDAELARAKESILNSFVFNYDSTNKILGQQMTYAFYGLPADFLETYRSNIESVGRSDVARVAKQYIHPDKLTLLVVGKSADFDKPMDSFGAVQTIDITIPPPADTRPAVEKSAASMATGAALLGRMAGSMAGGFSGEISAVRSAFTMELTVGGQTMAVQNTVSIVLPDKVRQTMNTPTGEQSIVFDGKAGFAAAGGQTRPLGAEQANATMESLARELLLLARYHDSPGIEAVAAGPSSDGACELVAVTFRDVESRLCVDAEGKVVKQTYQGRHPFQGTPGMVELAFSDYRSQDGLLVPHSRVMNFEGEQIAKMTLTSLEVNPSIDPADFEVPAP